MAAPVIQPSFAAGELAPSLYGRVDLAKFHVGAALLKNFFADYRGGVSNRPGTAFTGPCLSGINRLIPFAFSTLQTYALVFSDHKMHVVMNGALVLENLAVLVSGLPRVQFLMNVVPGPPPPAWVAGDWIYLEPNTGGVPATGVMNRFAGSVLQIAAVNAGPQYVIANAATGAIIDSSALPGGNGFVRRVYTLDTPYAAADLALLKFTQSADVMTICHPNYPTQELTRTAHNAWTITPASFVPTLGAPTITSVVPSLPGDNTIYTYVVTAIGANGVTESLPSAPVASTDSKTMSTTVGAFQDVTWTPPAGPAPQLYNVYRQGEVPGSAAANGQLFGFVGTCTGTSFSDHDIAPDFTHTPPQDPGILASVDNYPSCTNYFQQRQVFAATNNNPQTLYFSKTADFLNMQYSSPSQPNDAIVATLVSKQVNAIKHLISMDSLIAFTSNGAWKIDAGQAGGAVTPSQLDALTQVYNGCSDVPPVVVNRDILYVQAKGSSVRDLAYNEFVKIYTGSDLSVLSSHLFFGHRITEWAYAEEPFKLIWCVREDGLVLIFTYLKEQDVYAWTHAVTDGQVKSVCSISEGNEDAVYFLVERKLQGTRVQYIERLASRMLGASPEQGAPADFSKFWFADCALATPLNSAAATLTPNDGEQLDDGFWSEPHLVDATVVAGGAGYSAAATAVIEDPTGSGGRIVLTIIGGVITAASATIPGTNYTKPTVRIIDATGAGAIVHAEVARDLEFIADASVLGAVQVGSLFIGNGGYGYVRLVNSSRSVTVAMRQGLANDFPIESGDWTITAPVSAVHGLDHLEGREVVILADGNVHPSQVVTNGAVTLQAPASAVLVGLPYTARMESLYTDIPGEAPTPQGRRKVIPAVTVRMQDSRGLKVGLKNQREPLTEFKERAYEQMGNPIAAFTGDRRVVIPSKYDEASQVVVQQDLPLPATVLALIPEITMGDIPG